MVSKRQRIERRKPVTIQTAPRQVIEGKLLARLDDGAHVALIVNKFELAWLIDALYDLRPGEQDEIRDRWIDDLRKLRDSAFGG